MILVGFFVFCWYSIYSSVASTDRKACKSFDDFDISYKAKQVAFPTFLFYKNLIFCGSAHYV
jgi:hypothetical protein